MSVARIGGAGMDEMYMALMELEQEQRKSARAGRHAAQEAQVDAMMEQADHIESQAFDDAIGQGLTGLGEIAGGCIAGRGNQAGGNEGLGDAAKGGGKLAAAYFTYSAGQQRAAAKVCEARATAQGMVAADARDVEERAREMTQTLQRRLDQAQEAQSSAMSAILRA